MLHAVHWIMVFEGFAPPPRTRAKDRSTEIPGRGSLDVDDPTWLRRSRNAFDTDDAEGDTWRASSRASYVVGGISYSSQSDYISRRGFVWQYQGGKKHNKWAEYHDDVQETIEIEWQSGHRTLDGLITNGWTYFLDFTKMHQVSEDSVGAPRKTRRLDRFDYLAGVENADG